MERPLSVICVMENIPEHLTEKAKSYDADKKVLIGYLFEDKIKDFYRERIEPK